MHLRRKYRQIEPIDVYIRRVARPRMRLRWQLFWYALIIVGICYELGTK